MRHAWHQIFSFGICYVTALIEAFSLNKQIFTANKTFVLSKPGLASSEEECPLGKIVFSGDPSLNPSSSKKGVMSFSLTNFRIKRDPCIGG